MRGVASMHESQVETMHNTRSIMYREVMDAIKPLQFNARIWHTLVTIQY